MLNKNMDAICKTQHMAFKLMCSARGKYRRKKPSLWRTDKGQAGSEANEREAFVDRVLKRHRQREGIETLVNEYEGATGNTLQPTDVDLARLLIWKLEQ